VEETALRLTAQVAEQLQVQQVTFLTHNLTLVRAAAARKISDVQVPWELREQIVQYKRASTNLQPTIFHVKREINGVPHNCAQQEIRQSVFAYL
jgi:hypothetical protein